jgi:hypothetical protein
MLSAVLETHAAVLATLDRIGYSRIRQRQWNQRPKKRPKRRRIRVSTTESTIDVTIGK